MPRRPAVDDPILAVSALAEPTRRRLYELVATAREPVGRDDAAAAVGIARELAAFHLDRLVDAGLLETEYRRRSGRTGPGAGRPAKLYRRSDREVGVALPSRHYERAADVMASALARVEGEAGLAAVTAVGHERGAATGAEARRRLAGHRGRSRLVAALLDLLQDSGYEPRSDPDGRIRLGNCPYDALIPERRDITCGMNVAWAQGVIDGLGVPRLEAELAPEPGRCCVVLAPPPPPDSTD